MEYKNNELFNLNYITISGNVLCDVTKSKNNTTKNDQNNALSFDNNFKPICMLEIDGFVL